jgi:transposase
MVKETQSATNAQRRTHRTYPGEFKARLVAASQLPGACIAALALQHAMNANVLHRWIKEHERDGRHQQHQALGSVRAIAARAAHPAFVAVQLPEQAPAQAKGADIRVELRKGTTAMVITWPVAAAGDCAVWIRELLR